jgi:hypothetical protein
LVNACHRSELVNACHVVPLYSPTLDPGLSREMRARRTLLRRRYECPHRFYAANSLQSRVWWFSDEKLLRGAFLRVLIVTFRRAAAATPITSRHQALARWCMAPAGQPEPDRISAIDRPICTGDMPSHAFAASAQSEWRTAVDLTLFFSQEFNQASRVVCLSS